MEITAGSTTLAPSCFQLPVAFPSWDTGPDSGYLRIPARLLPLSRAFPKILEAVLG